MTCVEEWKPMPRLDHLSDEQNDEWINKYQISNQGRVWSNLTNKIRSCSKNDGYVIVNSAVGSKDKGNYKIINQRVHRMVGMQFIDNPENKPQINHINFIKTDNRVENLEWCTLQENIKHYLETSDDDHLKSRWESPYSHFTEEQYKYIWDNYKERDEEFGARALARKFGVHHCTILKVLKEKENELR